MAREIVFVESTLTFGYTNWEVYMSDDLPIMRFELGTKITVAWDGDEYTCIASECLIDGSPFVFVGNVGLINFIDGEDTGEPFVIICDPTMMMLATNEEGSSHTIGIYKEVAAQGVVLKDWDFNDMLFDDVTAVKLNMVDGSTKLFIPEDSVVAGDGENAVNFYDYDGTLVASYPLGKANTLIALPTPPKHDGLNFTGWNYTLDEVKGTTHALDVGATYLPDYGKSLFVVFADSSTPMKVNFSIKDKTNSNMVTVVLAWGDGESEIITETGNLTRSHTYATSGRYTIELYTFSDWLNIGFGHGSDTTSMFQDNPNCLERLFVGSYVSEITQYSFQDMRSLQSVTIPDTVKKLGASSLDENACTHITIPKGITHIGGNAISYCYALKSISLPIGLTDVYIAWLSHASNLERVILPDGMTTTGVNAFYGCYSLRTVYIPESVKTIAQQAFCNCYAMENIEIPSGVTTIDNGAFAYLRALKELTIPDGLTKISTNFCTDAGRLTKLVIPEGVTSIGSTAFKNTYSLRTLVLPSTLTSFGTNALSGSSIVEIFVPDDMVDEFKTMSYLSDYAHIIYPYSQMS